MTRHGGTASSSSGCYLDECVIGPADGPATPVDAAVVARAAAWMSRLWSGEASAADQAACAAWRAAHADHERAWQGLQVLQARFDDLPPAAARSALLAPAAARRRKVLRLLGLAAVGSGLTLALRETDTWQLAAAEHATATGEVREVELPDGTRLVLGTASAVDLRFTGRERRLILRVGEILVTTGHGPAAGHRPFLVQTAQGTVRALGTRFSVRQEEAFSRVAVFEGAVEIRPGSPDAEALLLAAGQGASFSRETALPAAAVEDSAAAWTQGRLVAERMRVADFVAELSRYRPGVLRCDPAVADLRVTGVFSLRDTDRALANLSLGLPVEIIYRSRWWVTVRGRR